VVPFGMNNGPTNFMCLMNNVLHPHLEKFMIVFINDLLIYSKNDEEHVEHLVAILILLRENHMYAKVNKCMFSQTEVHYLGHVSNEGISVDLENIRVIIEWPIPTNVNEVRSFMGLT